jgi:hypothetical protein
MQTQMQTQILNLLLILFIILFIYYIMYHFIYKHKEIKYDNDIDNDIYYYYNYNNKKKPERFDGSLISISEANKNINDLTNLQIYLNTYNNMLADSQIKASKQQAPISNLLTNRYILSYLESVDTANATAYKEYLKYTNIDKQNI